MFDISLESPECSQCTVVQQMVYQSGRVMKEQKRRRDWRDLKLYLSNNSSDFSVYLRN